MISTSSWTVLFFVALIEKFAFAVTKRPHICYILTDDTGWNDAAFHGSNEIPTPNIDALAYDGIIPQKHYVQPLCTPSRAALMTGKYPIRTGMQHFVLSGMEPRGLPLEEKILPERLNDLGYTSHIVGKWHLGFYKKAYTPLQRGFKSHLGFYTGRHDFYDHTACETGTWGLDIRRESEVAYDLHGEYTTDLITKRATGVIQNHNTSSPLFLYIAHAATHSGNNYSPIPVSEDLAANEFRYIKDYHRRRYAVGMKKLDDSVGAVVQALSKKNMLEDTIIVFASDNGGAAGGFNINAASNWPLKSGKITLWEGGVRGLAFVWSTAFKNPGRVYNELMSITDWYPTLLTAANGASNRIEGLDGRDVWDSLVNDKPNGREVLLHNIDSIDNNAALRDGPWKYVKGTVFSGQLDKYYGPSGRGPLCNSQQQNSHTECVPDYDVDLVLNSDTGKALKKINRRLSRDRILSLRQKATISCTEENGTPCNPLSGVPCLFNIDKDPCERNNVAERYPQIVRELETLLQEINKTAVPPGNRALDPRGNPNQWNYVWTNFGDLIEDYVPPEGPILEVNLSVMECNVGGGRIF